MRYSSRKEIILSLAIHHGLGAGGSQPQAPGSGALQEQKDNTSPSRQALADVSTNFSVKQRLIFSWGPVFSKQQLEFRQTIGFPERGSCRGVTGAGRGWRRPPSSAARPFGQLSRRPSGSSKQTPHRSPQRRQTTHFTADHNSV